MTQTPHDPQFPGAAAQPPPAPYGGQMPPGAYPQTAPPHSVPPKKKPVFKRWWFWVAIVVFVIIVGSCAGGGGGSDEAPDAANGGAEAGTSDSSAASEEDSEAQTEEDPEAAQAAEDAVEAYGIGDAVSAGDLEFTVTEVETGVSSIGNEFLGEDAQGQYILVHITISNTGDSAEMFHSSDVTLLDEQGREHSADGSAAMYLDDANSFLQDINPGNSVDGIVAFDIPADSSPETLLLSSGFFSAPVEVSLS